MLKRTIALSILTPLLCCIAMQANAQAQKLELADGDRIVLVGNTFFERDLYHNYFETLLTARHPDKQLHFRNMGWSGDTVWVNARVGSSPASNPQTLAKSVLDLKPTVIFLAYGMNESFDGEAGLGEFIEGYEALLDALAPANAKIILVSPTHHEDLGRPLPDPAAHNQSLKKYTEAIRQLAAQRKALFIDLYTPFEARAKAGANPVTDNGVHLNARGYRLAASYMGQQLGLAARQPRIDIDAATGQAKGTDVAVEKLANTPVIEFAIRDAFVPDALTSYTLRVTGLPGGKWRLSNSASSLSADAAQWAKGVNLDSESSQAEKLRDVIQAKNVLFFNQYRPQNDMYIFHGRKHEQGRNAREMPMFTPFIEEKEAEIARLRKPQPVKYVLERDER